VGEVPDHLKDSSRDAQALRHGQGYQYPHMAEDHFLPQQYLPRALLGTYFYTPTQQGYEHLVAERLARWREAQRKALEIETEHVLPDLPEERIKQIKSYHRSSRIEVDG